MSASELGAGALYERYHGVLLRYLVRFTGDAELAADVAQDAFVRMLEQPPRERGSTWLFRVATNLARDRARRASRRERLLRGAAERVPRADPAPPPDALLEAELRRRQVAAALATLSPKERMTLLMREEGFTQREIAEAVGTTTGSIGTLTARAIRKLAARLKDEAEVCS